MYSQSRNIQPIKRREAIGIALTFGLLALALRLYFVMHAQVLQDVADENVRSDATQYYHYAWNLVHRGTFSNASPSNPVALPDSFRDPGYPIFLSLAMKLTGGFEKFYGFVLIAQAFLGALTVLLLSLTGRPWLPRWALALAALLMAVWPHSVAIPAYLLSETLTGFLCAVALFATDHASKKHTAWAWSIAGILWSLAGLTNAVLLPVAMLMACLLWLRRNIDKRFAMTLALASLVLPLAWGIRSTGLSSASSTNRAVINLVQGSWPSYHQDFQLSNKNDFAAKRNMASIEAEMDAIQANPVIGTSMMYQRMIQSPITYAAWYLQKPALLWSWDIRIGQGDIYVYPTRNSPFFNKGILWPLGAACYIANPILTGLLLLGTIWAIFRNGAGVTQKSAGLLIVFVTLVYSALQSEPRYSVPFRGVEMLLAMGGADALASMLSSSSRR